MILKMQTVGDEGWAYIPKIARCRVLRCVVAEPTDGGKHGGPVLLYPEGQHDEGCDGSEPPEDKPLTRHNVNYNQSEFDLDVAKKDLQIYRERRAIRGGNPMEEHIHAYMIHFWREGDDPDMGPATTVLCNTRLFLTDDEGQTIDRYNRCIHVD